MKLKNPKRNESEIEVQESILNGLEVMRIGSFNRINNGGVYDINKKIFRRPSRHTPKGITDIIGCFKSRAVYIEVKTEDEFRRVTNFVKHVQESGTDLYLFRPESEWQKHILDQWRFINEKLKHGALAFFTYSLSHVLSKLEWK